MNILHFLGTGLHHEKTGQICQDYVNHYYALNGNVILTLSDGCGSAKEAAAASRLSCEAVQKYFSKISLDDFMKKQDPGSEIVNAVRKAFFKFDREKFADEPFAFSATLLFAVINKTGFITGHIGDGNIVCLDNDNNVICFSGAENGFADNITFFCADADAENHIRISDMYSVDKLSSILMYSDGPQKYMYYEGDGDNCKGAAGFVEQAISANIASCRDFAYYVAEKTCDSMFVLNDDWSFLLLDMKRKKQCRDISFQAVSMLERCSVINNQKGERGNVT